MTGTIDRLHPDGHTGRILGDDGLYYFLYRANVQTFSPVSWSHASVGMRVTFTPVESDRAKDDDRAIEVSIQQGTLDGR